MGPGRGGDTHALIISSHLPPHARARWLVRLGLDWTGLDFYPLHLRLLLVLAHGWRVPVDHSFMIHGGVHCAFVFACDYLMTLSSVSIPA